MLLSAQGKDLGGHAEKKCKPSCLGMTTSGKQDDPPGSSRLGRGLDSEDALSRAITDGLLRY